MVKKIFDKHIPKGRLIRTVSLIVCLNFTVVFFAPVDVYFSNAGEFNVNIAHFVLPLLLTALALSLVGTALLVFLREKVYNIVSSLLFGFLLASYVQMLFFNGNMRQFTGDSVSYSNIDFPTILNFAIDYIIFFLPLMLLCIREKYPDKKILNMGKGKIILTLSAVIFCMQLSGSLSLLASAEPRDFKVRPSKYYFSYETLPQMSAENNVLVILTDRLDGTWLDSTIDKYPDLKEKLSDFTCYRNNVSCYTNTFPSVPEMLTSCKYDDSNWKSYLKNAWNSHNMIDDLKANDYKVNLLIDGSSTYDNARDFENKADNVRYLKTDNGVNYFGKNGIIISALKIAFGKISPYYMKDIFLMNLTSDFSDYYYFFDDTAIDILPNTITPSSDERFFEYMSKHPLTSDSDKKTFSFIHLNCAHIGLEEEYVWDTVYQELTQLSDLFEQMKELGIYDNSTIIILGDHGRTPSEVEMHQKDRLDDVIVTSLLIKKRNDSHETMQFNDTAELSNSNLAASVLESADINTEQYGNSYFDIIDNNLHQDRSLTLYFWQGLDHMTKLGVYSIKDDARNFENWTYEPVK